MNSNEAEKIIKKYIKPVYAFTVKNCRNLYDAEDLSQDIMLKSYRVLLLRDDIEDYGKYIWTIARNCLSNYYRKQAPCNMNLPINAAIGSGDNPENEIIDREEARALQTEIARLSDIKRKTVIAYYYENKSIKEIAEKLEITESGVKWHLFKTKKNLKEGLTAMRTNELKFNPVKFEIMRLSGSAGRIGGTAAFFRSALS